MSGGELLSRLYDRAKPHLPNTSGNMPLALVSAKAADNHGIAHLPVKMWQLVGGAHWQVGGVTMEHRVVPNVPHIGLKITEKNVDSLPVGSHIWQWTVYDGAHISTVIAKQASGIWMTATDFGDEYEYVVDFDTAVLLSWGWPA